MPPTGYPHYGGTLSWTSGLTNLLAAEGVMTHVGKPLSEAMLLGIGGGLGSNYFVFEYKGLAPMVSIWFYKVLFKVPTYVAAITGRLKLDAIPSETSSEKAAEAALIAAMDAGHPAYCLTDTAPLPYTLTPPEFSGGGYHAIVVTGRDPDGNWLVDDRAPIPWVVAPNDLSSARGRIRQSKNLLITLKTGGAIPQKQLASAVDAGIAECVSAMTAPVMSNFGLGGLRKWAELVVNPKDKKGWPTMLGDGPLLYDALKNTYQSIHYGGLTGGAGGHLRGMYAAFLNESAVLTNRPELAEVGQLFGTIADEWESLAEAVFPDRIAPFKRVKTNLKKRNASFARGPKGVEERRKLKEELVGLELGIRADFPLTSRECAELRATLNARLDAIGSLEGSAFESLGKLVSAKPATAKAKA